MPCVAWQMCPIEHDSVILLTAPPSGTFTPKTIVGVYLAIPIDFFHDDMSKAPDVWGYVGKVSGGSHADQPAFKVQFHDGFQTFYLNRHPKFLHNEQHRFLNNPMVKVVGIAAA